MSRSILRKSDEHLAPLFALRLVRGVKNGPSPAWLQERLRAIGLRPINALVDVTNYLTFDRARPLHVFDAKKVAGDLIVRRAREGEELLALDGKTYELDADMVVIADDNGLESLAGVMGGEHSGCGDETTDVLIETALWDPPNIAHTGRKLGISTDARYRFERGVDPAFALPGLELATKLVLEFCGGEASDIVVAGAAESPARTLRFPWSETKRLTGLDISREEATAILARLGFAVEAADDAAIVTVPSWRPDIEGKADIVEEIVRIAGFDKIATAPLPRVEGVTAPVLTLLQKRTRAARRALAARGLVEAVTWSFVSEGAGDGLRRRRRGPRARQSDRLGTVRHAAEPAARPRRRRRPQCRARLRRCRAVRGRPDFRAATTRRARRSPRPACVAASLCRRGRAAIGRLRSAPSASST